MKIVSPVKPYLSYHIVPRKLTLLRLRPQTLLSNACRASVVTSRWLDVSIVATWIPSLPKQRRSYVGYKNFTLFEFLGEMSRSRNVKEFQFQISLLSLFPKLILSTKYSRTSAPPFSSFYLMKRVCNPLSKHLLRMHDMTKVLVSSKKCNTSWIQHPISILCKNGNGVLQRFGPTFTIHRSYSSHRQKRLGNQTIEVKRPCITLKTSQASRNSTGCFHIGNDVPFPL